MVEAGLRDAIQAEFPDDGVRGEELSHRDKHPAPGAGTWYIDPNDGTEPYLSGWRGASVSIARVVDGRPVLGVVFAYAVGKSGDELAWAEGMSAILRNGALLPPRRWPMGLGRDECVLLTHYAARSPRTFALAASPARFHPVPGVAYRFATCAAGDAAAAVSVGNPVDYDVAASHALLRGAGAELVHADLSPLRYGEGTWGQGFFAGPTSALPDLVKGQWDHWGTEAEPSLFELCEPRRGVALRSAPVRHRATGAWLGQLIGDALGAQVEGMDTYAIRRRHPAGVVDMRDGRGPFCTLAGQPTDDSEMALALARTLLRDGRFDAAQTLDSYIAWLATNPFDLGATVGRALRAGLAQQLAGAPQSVRLQRTLEAGVPDSQANGAAMRVSPLGIFGWAHNPDTVAHWAREDARLTHPHPLCLDSSAIIAVAISHGIASGDGPRATAEHVLQWAKRRCTAEAVSWLDAATQGPPPLDVRKSAGWVALSLWLGFRALWTEQEPAQALQDIVDGGGDTDTHAAIAGALLGAVHGAEAWPRNWVQPVLTCRPQEGLEGVRHPRPRWLWPTDALVLAEHLALAGQEAAGLSQ
jgi:ADP-ribosylglycohydrolase/fructose-1,6-bisphosphatase/inositol monophosphatase family enzyme